MKSFSDNSCPKCGFRKMKAWNDLTDDQQFLAERLPASAEYTIKQRKKHRFCERCWFEETGSDTKLA